MFNKIFGSKTQEPAIGPDLEAKGANGETLAADMKNSAASADALREALSKMSKPEIPSANKAAGKQEKNANQKAVDVSREAPLIQKITKLSDIDGCPDFDDKAKANAKTLLGKLGFTDDRANSPEDFVYVHIEKNPSGAKLVVDLSGKNSAAKLFKKGFWYACHSWFSSWFSGLRKNYGTRFLNQNSGINLYDPANPEAKLEPDLNTVVKYLNSGRYSTSVVYDPAAGNFKEPQAISLYDNVKPMLEDMKKSIPEGIPEEIKKQIDAELNSFTNAGLDHYVISNLVLLNPAIKEQYTSAAPEAFKKRQELLTLFAETNTPDTTMIYPHQIFANEVSKTRSGHIYEALDGLKTIEKVGGTTKEKAVTGTVIRNRSVATKPIAAEAFSKIFAMHALHDLISDPSQMTQELMMQVSDIQKVNIAAVNKFNERVSGVAAKPAEPTKEEKAKDPLAEIK